MEVKVKANGFKQLVLADRLSCAIFPISSGTPARQRQRFACPRLRPKRSQSCSRSRLAHTINELAT